MGRPRERFSPYVAPDGYVRDPIARDRVHRLIMKEALGRELKRDEVVHHKDGDRTNNSLDNLEVLTISEHIKTHGKRYLGSQNGAAKLTEEDVRELRSLKKQGVTNGRLAWAFGISEASVSLIVRRKSWTHVE